MIAVPATPARMIAVTNGANSRIVARTKKPPRRSIAPNRTRKLPACRPGRAVAERDRRDQQREPAQLEREQELVDELPAVRIGRADRRQDRLPRQDHHVADLLEQVLSRQEYSIGCCAYQRSLLPARDGTRRPERDESVRHRARRVATGNLSLNPGHAGLQSARDRAPRRLTPVVCSARFGGLARAPEESDRRVRVRVHAGACRGRLRMRRHDRQGRPPGQGRAGGRLPVAVEEAEFPPTQKLARDARRCASSCATPATSAIPNIAVTVQCEDDEGRPERLVRPPDRRAGNADKNRPNFVVDRIPGSSARLAPGPRPARALDRVREHVLAGAAGANRTATFEWRSPRCARARSGSATGRRRPRRQGQAVPASGILPLEHEWHGDVTERAPRTGVADDGTSRRSRRGDPGGVARSVSRARGDRDARVLGEALGLVLRALAHARTSIRACCGSASGGGRCRRGRLSSLLELLPAALPVGEERVQDRVGDRRERAGVDRDRVGVAACGVAVGSIWIVWFQVLRSRRARSCGSSWSRRRLPSGGACGGWPGCRGS